MELGFIDDLEPVVVAQIRSAGLEFRVPTSAVNELPHFSSDGSALQAPGTARAKERHQRRWFEFAPRQAAF